MTTAATKYPGKRWFRVAVEHHIETKPTLVTKDGDAMNGNGNNFKESWVKVCPECKRIFENDREVAAISKQENFLSAAEYIKEIIARMGNRLQKLSVAFKSNDEWVRVRDEE